MRDLVLKMLQNSIDLSNEIGDRSDFYIQEINNARAELRTNLSEDQMKLVDNLIRYVEYHIFDTRDRECVEAFYLGLKIGQDMSEVLNVIENKDND